MPHAARRLRFLVLICLLVALHTASRPPLQAASDISLWAAQHAVLHGSWTVTADSSAAGGQAIWHPDGGAAKLTTAQASPADYFEVTFTAEAGVPYRLWLRGRAQNDYWGNDSVFVQLSSSVSPAGTAQYRVGTTSALTVNLEDCSGCGLSRWGWQDDGYGAGVLGPEVLFASTGTQVMRVQTREDGLIVDQIVLSPFTYLTSAPGTLKNDTTIVPQSAAAPSVTLVRGPYVQQLSATEARILWATRQSGTAEVRYAGGQGTAAAAASGRLVPATTTGLGYDYYHYEARLTGLTAETIYTYDPFVSGFDVTPQADTFRTAPASGSGAVRFIALGDSGTGSTEQRQLSSLIDADTFDIALHTGDVAYGAASGTGDASYSTYQSWFFSVYGQWLPAHGFFPAEGNHDSRPGNGDGKAYVDLFSLPRDGGSAVYPDHAERYYSFDYGPVHFVALDTEFTFQDVNRRAEQLAWLEADLASTTQPWTVAYFHRSPYSSGAEHGSDLAVRDAFGPLFERYGVQLALSAHDHDYERSVPTRAGSSGTAVTYVVTGGGGGPLYTAGTSSWTAYSASRHHYVRVSADTCTLRLDAVGLDGIVFDRTQMSRCTAAAADVVLYASMAPVRTGAWRVESDATAAGGKRMRHPDAGAAKLSSPLANPAHYFELTFNAQAGVPYRLWIRGKADNNYWGNDSVFAQFSGSVATTGASQFRIGTSSAATLNIEDCSGCGLSGWGWQDDGYGAGVLGPEIYFAASGAQRIRIQTREDGLAIDQIVLSPSRYLAQSPGALKNDTTILTQQ